MTLARADRSHAWVRHVSVTVALVQRLTFACLEILCLAGLWIGQDRSISRHRALTTERKHVSSAVFRERRVLKFYGR